tara:strand:- start:40 stop:756 length:717 start_codon:yes stop_codon:yes gene_type:complete
MFITDIVSSLNISGYYLAIIEIFIFYLIAKYLKIKNRNLYGINNVVYYWLMFTSLTAIWEACFIYNYKDVYNIAEDLKINKKHIWTNKYDIINLLPWNFSYLFYAEYAAFADREYMSFAEDWSRIIEGTHLIFCGIFAMFSISYKIINLNDHYLITMSVSMGTQLMNSILYISNYICQINNPSSINYNTNNFPTGLLLSKRPFFWINALWTVMPFYIILYTIINQKNDTIYEKNLLKK